METIVLQPLGKVGHPQTCTLLKLCQINQTLVRDTTILVRESKIVVRLETFGDIVGVEERNLGDGGETLATEHLDVSPGNGVDARGTIRSGRDGCDRGRATGGDDGVRGKEGGEVGFTRDGADTGTATAVRDGEGLVEVSVGYITPDTTKGSQANERVTVCA